MCTRYDAAAGSERRPRQPGLARSAPVRFVGAVVPVDLDPRSGGHASSEGELLARLRSGDEQAFQMLVDRHYATMVAVARTHVGSRAVAEEVVQDAWIGVLRGLDGFEGRSSLQTWIMRIVSNTAMRRGGAEAQTVPFSSLAAEGEEAAVDPERFRGPGDGFPGHWRAYPRDWGALPEERLLGRETLDVVRRAIDDLPPAQRTVITLRDVYGYGTEEVCATLDIEAAHQRVLLHRARSRVRAVLERHFDD
jgi:RNA polymerase sigma-70 factor, ECF subfamily